MANRRMFSKTIIGSARFLKMPIDSQNLYFHLGMNADDEGVVEAFSIMRLTGSSEDNLRVLASKGFIAILNEDLVSFILDWNEHNLIRSDRKIDSKYKNLLIEFLPQKEQKKLLKKNANVKEKNSNVRQVTDKCQPDAKKCRHRLGKDRLGEGRVGEERVEKDKLVSTDSTVLRTVKEEKNDPINFVFSIFYKHNKSINFGNKSYRKSIETLIARYGLERTIGFAEAAMACQGQPFAPTINSPLELSTKLIALKGFYEKMQAEQKNKQHVFEI